MSKIGIDISTYQKNINYDEACKHIDFCIIRVGYGVSYLPDSQRDKEFDNHYNGFKGKLPLGAYYYAYGTDYDTGRKEAENCLSYMGDKQFEMPIYYDMEENRNTKEAGQGFVDRIREAGLKAGIYASSSFYQNKRLEDIDCDSVWIAQYGSNNGNIPSSKPSIRYDIWQYTSKGYVEGIGSNIDMDIQENDVPSPTPSPSPEPTPKQSGNDKIKKVQDWLNNNYGTGIAVDGFYGSQTKKALVKALQTEFNRQFGTRLAVDGIFGEQSKNACRNIKQGAKGNITRIIQSMLYCKGYNTNGIEGIFGQATDGAVRRFQANSGLNADGVVGKLTFAKLFE